MSVHRWMLHRAKRRGLHGHRHISNQRLISLLMVSTGIARALVWLGLILASLAGVGFFVHLFQQVFWVAILSLYANFATDLSTVAGSWASLVAGDAHADVEHARREVALDYQQLERDIAQLANLVGPEAHALESQILKRLHG